MEESGTTGGNILPGGIEIACVPRVCHVVRVVGMIHQQRYLVLGIGTDDALDAAQVGVIHGDDKVVIVVVGTRHLAGGFSLATDAIFGQLAAGGRIYRIAPLFSRGGCRRNLKLLLQSGLKSA